MWRQGYRESLKDLHEQLGPRRLSTWGVGRCVEVNMNTPSVTFEEVQILPDSGSFSLSRCYVGIKSTYFSTISLIYSYMLFIITVSKLKHLFKLPA